MSMICWILGVTPAQITALRTTPSLASNLVIVAQDTKGSGRFDELMKRMQPEQRKQFEANRSAFEATPAGKELQRRTEEARERMGALAPIEQALSLEKSWHILHYLFTGHVDPANAPGDLLLTGEDVGDDVGYGPARLHSPSEVRDFGQFLETLDLARLQARVNYGEMSRLRVYSMPMGQGSEAEYESMLREEVGHYFPLLRDYVRAMSQKGNGLLTWVS